MSKIEQLLKKLCPDGVEYRPLGEVFCRLRGTPITAGKMKEIAVDDGEIRIFAGGKTVVNAHEKNIPNANITRVPAVLVQSRGVIDFVYYDKPFTFKNEMWAYTATDPISVKFLYYFLQNNAQYFRDSASGMGSLPQISLRVTEDFLIPVPPLEIQREVVEILDKFAQYTAELTAELAKRKKQYEHYRRALLGGVESGELRVESEGTGHGEHGDDGRVEVKRGREKRGSKWPMVKLGEVCEKICSGGTPNVARKEYYGGEIPWLRTQEVDWRDIKDTAVKITNEGLDNSSAKWIEANCVIVAMYGATAGKVAINKIPLTTNQACCNLQVDPKKASYRFVFHWLSDRYEQLKSLGQGSQSNINAKIVRDFPIPLPPLAEQERIVKILDRFDALCNSLSEGLPAEIEGRKKQYCYYRDKLLNFKKLRVES